MLMEENEDLYGQTPKGSPAHDPTPGNAMQGTCESALLLFSYEMFKHNSSSGLFLRVAGLRGERPDTYTSTRDNESAKQLAVGADHNR